MKNLSVSSKPRLAEPNSRYVMTLLGFALPFDGQRNPEVGEPKLRKQLAYWNTRPKGE
jgi:hypothetical protein